MPASDYVLSIRRQIGISLLLLPGVTAVIRDGSGRYLLARHVEGDRWGLVGGAVEPLEEPREALTREVREELGVTPTIDMVLDSYGGPELQTSYANGDVVSYVTTAYLCHLTETPRAAEAAEVRAVGWFSLPEIAEIPHFQWIDRVIRDAESRVSSNV